LVRSMKHSSHIGEVVFAVRVRSRKTVNILIQGGSIEGIEAGVDLADFLLPRSRGLFFDNRLYFSLSTDSSTFANHTAISIRIVEISAEQSHRRLLCAVKVAEFPNRLGGNQWSVSGKYDNLVIFTTRECFACHYERVSGATLLGLEHEVHAGAGNRRTHALRLMADDHEYVARGRDLCSRGDHIRQDRLAADLMQNLGMFRFESRALARRHNRDGDTRALWTCCGRRPLDFWRFCHAQTIYRENQLRIACRTGACAISAIRSCATWSVACRATSPSSR